MTPQVSSLKFDCFYWPESHLCVSIGQYWGNCGKHIIYQSMINQLTFIECPQSGLEKGATKMMVPAF